MMLPGTWQEAQAKFSWPVLRVEELLAAAVGLHQLRLADVDLDRHAGADCDLKYTEILLLARRALADFLVQHALRALLDAALHGDDAAERGVELRVGRRLALERRPTPRRGTSGRRASRAASFFTSASPSSTARWPGCRSMRSRSMCFQFSFHCSAGLSASPACALERRPRAPVLDGVAEADVALDAPGRIDLRVGDGVRGTVSSPMTLLTATRHSRRGRKQRDVLAIGHRQPPISTTAGRRRRRAAPGR